MVRNNFMMQLCTFATLYFFKITFPRNYYYCNQDDTIPWVCVLKYVSNSNCCHRHLKLYISMFKSFHTYRKYIYQQSSQQISKTIQRFLISYFLRRNTLSEQHGVEFFILFLIHNYWFNIIEPLLSIIILIASSLLLLGFNLLFLLLINLEIYIHPLWHIT